eukprot:scaffold11724_cov124-Isochrysis_galbana.AAC.4
MLVECSRSIWALGSLCALSRRDAKTGCSTQAPRQDLDRWIRPGAGRRHPRNNTKARLNLGDYTPKWRIDQKRDNRCKQHGWEEIGPTGECD